MSDVNGLVSLALNSCFEGNDVKKIKKCIAGYSTEAGTVGYVKKLIYMMKEAVYGCFGMSDRQVAKRAITDKAFSVIPLGLFIGKEDFDKLSDKLLTAGVYVNQKAPNISENTYRTAFKVALVSYQLLTAQNPVGNQVVLYQPSKAQSTTNLKKDYDVLGLAFGATKEQVKKAYLNMMKKYHPDKVVKDVTESLETFNARKEQIVETFKMAKNAYNRIILSVK